MVRDTWRVLNVEQRVAAAGAALLIVSTFGPFSFVEAAIVLIGVAVLALLRSRAAGRRFHLPLGDGTAILAAALWSALLILTRLFDRPLGLSALALGCAAILAAAGLRERAKRPPDDLPPPAPPRGTTAAPTRSHPSDRGSRSRSATAQPIGALEQPKDGHLAPDWPGSDVSSLPPRWSAL